MRNSCRQDDNVARSDGRDRSVREDKSGSRTDRHEKSVKSAEFSHQVIEHVDSLYNAALRMSRSETDAEDLVQETLYRAFKYFDQARSLGTLKAWLFQILRNTYINLYRKSMKDPDTKDFQNIDEVSDELVDERFLSLPVRGGETRLRHEFHDEVAMAIDQLADEYKLCIILRDIEGFTYEEISEITGDPIGTVKSRLFRARKILHVLLWDYASKRGYTSD